MDRLVYTALSGMRRAQFAQGLTAHNLANATTTGFRRDVGAFESQWLAGGELWTRAQAGEQTLGSELDGGPVQRTGRALDVALGGAAMLAVEGADGEAYTRRGDLVTDAEGVLRTGDGRAVVGEGGPITLPPAEAVEIGADGTVSVREAGAAPGAPLQPVERLKLVTAAPGALAKGLDGLFVAPGGALAADPAARLTPGALEGSNVSPVGALTDLIEQSRAFELHAKIVGETRDLDRASAELMRID